jgi:hypothetical protein
MNIVRTVALVCLLATSACKKDDGKPAAPSPTVARLEELAGKACACKDAACADGVGDEVVKIAASAGKLSDADITALQASQEKIDRCLAAQEPALIAYVGLIDAACACANKACAEKAAKKVSKWAAELETSKRKLRAGDAKLVLTEHGGRGAKCFEKHGVPIPQ